MTRGALEAGCTHLEAGLTSYSPAQHRAYVDGYGQDPGVGCLHFLGLALWLRGYPAQAFARLDTVVHLARQLAHPLSLLFSMNGAAILHQHCRNGPAVQQWRRPSSPWRRSRRCPTGAPWGRMYHGWALAAQGQLEAGIAQVQQGLAACRATGSRFVLARWLGLLAELHGSAGQGDAGRALLAEACAVVRQDGLSSCAAELARIQGDFLLQTGTERQEGDAEAHLRQALTIARRQQAHSLELRAALSLARLWQRHGQTGQEAQRLAGTHLSLVHRGVGHDRLAGGESLAGSVGGLTWMGPRHQGTATPPGSRLQGSVWRGATPSSPG